MTFFISDVIDTLSSKCTSHASEVTTANMENCSDDYPVSPSPDTALTGQERGKGEKAGRRGGGDRGRGDRREGEKKVVGNEKLTDAKVKVLTSLI